MRRNMWFTLLAILALVVVGVWGRGQAMERQVLENHLLAEYQRSFYDLAAGVENIEVLLSKTPVANGDLSGELFAKISAEAQAAQGNLTNLPVEDVVVARTAKFLSQTGDYAARMFLKGADGEVTGGDKETLAGLQQQAQELNKQIHTIEGKVSDGSVSLVEMIRESQVGLKKQEGRSPPAGNDFDGVDELMQNYPTLIYDGPFSDHMESRQPVSLPGDDIQPDAACKKALNFIEKDSGVKYKSKVINNIKGRIPAYGIEVVAENDRSPKAVIAISKKGGHPLWMIIPHLPDNVTVQKWTLQSTRDKAMKFLSERGFKNMEAVGHQTLGNLITHVFVPCRQNTWIYSEPLKVTVAQDNGRVTAFEAGEYVMMHHQRQLPRPKISSSEAREKLKTGPDIKVEEERLVITTTDALEEFLAYEFKVSKGKEIFLIYINAENGKEENILRVLEGPEGTYTI